MVIGDPNGIYTWAVYARRGIELMLTLYPLMSPRRRERIREVVHLWRDRKCRGGKYKQYCRSGRHLWIPENWTKSYSYRGPQCILCVREARRAWMRLHYSTDRERYRAYSREHQRRRRGYYERRSNSLISHTD